MLLSCRRMRPGEHVSVTTHLIFYQTPSSKSLHILTSTQPSFSAVNSLLIYVFKIAVPSVPRLNKADVPASSRSHLSLLVTLFSLHRSTRYIPRGNTHEIRTLNAQSGYIVRSFLDQYSIHLFMVNILGYIK